MAAPHWVQPAAPVLCWKNPAAHWRQADSPLSGWYWPAAHAEHTALPGEAETVPGEQLKPPLPSNPEVGQNLPTGQGKQAAAPWTGW